MQLMRALRLSAAERQTICFVGAGGKSTALFQLAHQFVEHGAPAVFVSASTHLGAWQIAAADFHVIIEDRRELERAAAANSRGVILFTGPLRDDRTSPLDSESLASLDAVARAGNVPLLIEADGSRGRPLKAPAPHEPAIPDFAELGIVVAGLSGIGTILDDEHVHRAEIFAALADARLGDSISAGAIARVLAHADGGLKNIPAAARRVALLNQADSVELQSIGGEIARTLGGTYDAVLVGSLQSQDMHTFEQTAGIVLAAGESTRYGSLKQLLDWHGQPFVRRVAEAALRAGLEPVAVVTGFRAADVASALRGLPVQTVENPDYRDGQSTSIVRGVRSLPARVGSAVFLLCDQPQIPAEVIRALVETHAASLPAILAPLVLGERRANPVLFDRATFPELLKLHGDVGGRAIFDKFKVDYLPWHDDLLLFDVDQPDDYQRLLESE